MAFSAAIVENKLLLSIMDVFKATNTIYAGL
jgi:hypothetical protein